MHAIRGFAFLFMLMISLPAMAAEGSPPRLIVAISVDQFSADLFAEYRQHFRGGLKRLSDGVVFPSGYQGHASTETCPGHSTILTGSRPARTGIIANSWYDLSAKRIDKLIYCAEDENQPGIDSRKYIASPAHLRVPTLGERMKVANGKSRVVAVAGKDRSALMMAGHGADQIWWWGGQDFVTLKGRASHAVAERMNEAVAAHLKAPQSAVELPQQCRDRNVEVQAGRRLLGTGRFSRAAGDAQGFRASPELDRSTLALAAGFRDAMKLGEGAQTDLLIIGASATDYVGHAYGTEGTEMCLQLMALDRELGSFFDALDKAHLNYLVVLTADHGGHDLPERSRINGMPGARRIDPDLNAGAINKAIATKLGLSGRLVYADGPNGDYYIARDIPDAQRAIVADEAAAVLKAHSQVAAVFRHEDLASAPMPEGPPDSWTIAQRVRASFDVERSGDLVVVLKPWVTPIAVPAAGVATHGSPWDYDRRVPILFWYKGIHAFEQPLAVETADIMPTLAAQIGLGVPSDEIDGRCLDLIAGEGDSCR